MGRSLLARLRFLITGGRAAPAGPSANEDELGDLARAEPDRLYREGGNWMWVGPEGVSRIVCPRCSPGGGGTLSRIRMKGSDDLFYLCDECDALWPVEQFDWHNYTVGLVNLSRFEARGLFPDDWEDS
jgi:hypothetical protein